MAGRRKQDATVKKCGTQEWTYFTSTESFSETKKHSASVNLADHANIKLSHSDQSQNSFGLSKYSLLKTV